MPQRPQARAEHYRDLDGSDKKAAVAVMTPTPPKKEDTHKSVSVFSDCQKRLRRIFRVSGKQSQIVFDRGAYVGENTSQAASVEFVRRMRTNYARSRLQKTGGKARRGFSTS